MSGLHDLRAWFPWPTQRPDGPDECHGWFASENRAKLAEVLGPDTRIVLEAGSYQGFSSRFIAEHAPNATVICNDHWLGSLEHLLSPEWRAQLPGLYTAFLRNLWPYRHRVIPLRTTIQDGIRILDHLAIRPDVIYLDGSHDTRSVREDVTAILGCFPGAFLIGDDYGAETVRAGLHAALQAFPGRFLEAAGNCWWIRPTDG